MQELHFISKIDDINKNAVAGKIDSFLWPL